MIQQILETLRTIPGFDEHMSMVYSQNEKTGKEYIVLWTKKDAAADFAARERVSKIIQD